MGLIARCTSPLPNVLLQEGFRTPKLIDNFLKQMSIIANYRKVRSLILDAFCTDHLDLAG